MRLINADELKSIYSKEETAIRSRLFSVIDRTPEHEEGKYQRLAEQFKAEKELLEQLLEDSIPIIWIEQHAKELEEMYFFEESRGALAVIDDWKNRNEDWRKKYYE